VAGTLYTTMRAVHTSTARTVTNSLGDSKEAALKGVTEGDLVIFLVGEPVFAVGAAVTGLADGLAVGTLVGALVFTVGFTVVGALVFTVGFTVVGALVFFVGAAVGFLVVGVPVVGTAVGAAVGALVSA